MYSTTTLAKNTKLSGQFIGTHQLLDQAARRVLAKHLPRGCFFPNAKQIIQFEGTRGPDGLKRKSPDDDDPSHMFGEDNGADLFRQIMDHRHNLIQALREKDQVRAAFEAAWMAHKITDGMTPAHHFPLAETRTELMSNKDFVKVFGAPIKGLMHGRTAQETLRNNWKYWGANGHMTRHVGYEYGVILITAAMPQRALLPQLKDEEFKQVNPRQVFYDAIQELGVAAMYEQFRKSDWTLELIRTTKDQLLPGIVRVIALLWYSAVEEAYGLNK